MIHPHLIGSDLITIGNAGGCFRTDLWQDVQQRSLVSRCDTTQFQSLIDPTVFILMAFLRVLGPFKVSLQLSSTTARSRVFGAF